MKNKSIIALLTDFGLCDGYVASMKGVIHSIIPDAKIVDITNEISPQNVNEAAFILWSVYKYFPSNTIFISVVDPGVGSSRNIVCVKTKDHIFLAPDNGLLKYIIASDRVKEVVSVTNKKYFCSEVSSTFHGRDIFAPLAAHLLRGIPLRTLGEKIDPVTKPEAFINLENQAPTNITGKVIHIDRFGNIITNVLLTRHDSIKNISFIQINKQKVKIFRNTYSEEKSNKPFALIGSRNLLEISVRDKSAAKLIKAKVGMPVKIYTSI
jgi:hypothetical protein